ncbi:BREX system ATP-binding domain-containing protein [Marinimicrobium locisalis]|uniref:BREX system ATP-binding domain-containing protein n=1 Tax=Marinimicrobium locisalis TaxID=546022 RepID=UPI0032218EA8
MKLGDILAQYPETGLDQLARDKLDEIANVRLPRQVLEQEIATALSSFAYIADVLAESRPPTYAILKLLMESPDRTLEAVGFRERVLARTDEITEWIGSGEGLPDNKGYEIYRRMLCAAWEAEERIDESEGRMLEALREALDMSMREHLLMEHHPDVRPLWESGRAYELARNYLLGRGLVLATGDHYILPDEVRIQVRRYWGMELHDADYRRLLMELTGRQLRDILNVSGLPLSGSKEERVERTVAGLVSPSAALGQMGISGLKALARDCDLKVSLPKAELISQVIAAFDNPKPSEEKDEAEEAEKIAQEPPRQLSPNQLFDLLSRFSGNQLYEILASLRLPRSGSKNERVQRLVDSRYAESTLFGQLRRRDLSRVCRKLGLAVSGLKDDLIERLCGEPTGKPAELVEESVAPTAAVEDSQALEQAGPEPGEEESGSAPEVPGLDSIQRLYPALGEDEQVMLSLAREARSLNERDVERLALRHGLGWMLPKAHMADMLRKLSDEARAPIRIRSTGAANIYEWVDDPDGDQHQLDRWAARDIVDALRQGVVPERHLDMMFVGQEEARMHMLDQLEHIATGRSAFKFIRGAYGSGKSFMMAWLRDAALNAGFAVATVRVSAEMSLADLSEFYQGLMDGLRVPEKRGASSLSDVLEAWLLTMQQRTEQVEGLSSRRPSDRKQLIERVRKRIQDQLSQLASHDPGFAPALGAFYEARLVGDEEKAMHARAWLRGDRSLPNAALKQIGVKGNLESDQVLPRLRALLEIIEATHLRGLVILIDELELVRRRPHKGTRDKSYETLRALIDEVGENRLPRCLLVSTGTDTFFDDRRYGLASYEALYHRVCAPELTENFQSVRQPVIYLEGLNEERLLELAGRARSIHARAYNWPADERFNDEDLRALVSRWTDFGGECIDRLPRPFLRQLVHVLDICEENPQIAPQECFADPQQDPQANEELMRLVAN